MAHSIPLYVCSPNIQMFSEATGFEPEELAIKEDGKLIGLFLVPNEVLCHPSVEETLDACGVDYTFAFEGFEGGVV